MIADAVDQLRCNVGGGKVSENHGLKRGSGGFKGRRVEFLSQRRIASAQQHSNHAQQDMNTESTFVHTREGRATVCTGTPPLAEAIC